MKNIGKEPKHLLKLGALNSDDRVGSAHVLEPAVGGLVLLGLPVVPGLLDLGHGPLRHAGDGGGDGHLDEGGGDGLADVVRREQGLVLRDLGGLEDELGGLDGVEGFRHSGVPFGLTTGSHYRVCKSCDPEKNHSP